MNQQIIQNYIGLYKTHFNSFDSEELYKWQAIRHFQSHWNSEADDFALMLKKSLKQTNNLLSSGNYLARRMIIMVAEQAPEKIRKLFQLLYDESADLQIRLENFRSAFITLKDIHTDKKNHYQDDRAIIVYLTLQNPSKYHFYKFEMFKSFLKKTEHIYKPKQGAFQNITEFQLLCNKLKGSLITDDALLKMHHDRLDESCYQDPEYTVLTQDFIYACVRHLQKDSLVPTIAPSYSIEQSTIEDYKLKKLLGTLKGAKINFEEKQRENKKLGLMGEEFVIKIEQENIKSSKYRSKLKQLEHVSQTKGDGLGYDIKSIDEHGNEIFIEVKTTKGGFSSPFFITNNELLCSEKHKAEYRLYRLHNFNFKKQTGKIKVFSGSLIDFCKHPTNYHVKLKNN